MKQNESSTRSLIAAAAPTAPRVLLVTQNFATPATNEWLLDDLAYALARRGAQVDVIVHSPTVPRPRGADTTRHPQVTVFSVGAERAPQSAFGKAVAYASTAIRLHTSAWKHVRNNSYDLVIFNSIGCFTFGFPARLRRRGVTKQLLFLLWDFFPVHQLEIGRVRWKALGPLLKHCEWRSMRNADSVAIMSPANEAFLRSYHRKFAANSVIIPPWAAPLGEGAGTGAVQDAGGEHPPSEAFTVVFGGQLVRGRGVETLIEAAAELQRRSCAVRVLIAGDGAERASLEVAAEQLAVRNVEFLGLLDRTEYRGLLGTADVGIAVTVAGVSVPSFPSKIVEYCANSVPVIVCVEATSDAADVVEAAGAGVKTPVGDPIALANAIEGLAAESAQNGLQQYRQAAQRLFRDELSSDSAAEKILGLL